MADIGYIALVLALVVALYSAGAYIMGVRGRNAVLIRSARNALLAVCGLVTISVAIMLYALITHNFQIEYVSQYTSRDLSFIYLITGLWAGNDGSLLLWGWLITIFAAIVVLQRRDIGKVLVPYASSVLMITAAFFLFLMVLDSNPFSTLPYKPVDGRGLNPLLENPGMIIHPPLLLFGYVGLAVPFAFAISALITRRFGDEWVIVIRRWTIIGWIALGIGNLIGAWWAYNELGWGGYWAWDPVENAGIMPWLVATAFLHSIMMQRRRGMLKKWNMALIILAFCLSIFGTFMTRSGVFSSVHTFGQSTLGPFFLIFISITLIGSFYLLFSRTSDLAGESEMESLVSRESTFLLNNLLLVGSAFAIFLGTVFPLISEAVRGVKITVGPPFFNQVNSPIFLATILLAGICTLIGWRRASIKNMISNFLWPLVSSIVLGILLVVVGIKEAYAVITFVICWFVLLTVISELYRGTRARHRIRSENFLKAFFGLIGANKPRYGGYIVHVAILLMAVGIVGSTTYSVEKEVVLLSGESMNIEDYTLTYDSIDRYETQSKEVVTAVVSVRQGGSSVGKLVPEKYFHRSFEQSVTEVAIRSTLIEDLYLILVSEGENGQAAFKVLVNPLTSWIWIGGFVFFIGGMISLWPDRRKPKMRESAAKKE